LLEQTGGRGGGGRGGGRGRGGRTGAPNDGNALVTSVKPKNWLFYDLLGRGLQQGANTAAAIPKGIAGALGAGARAVGNLGAALDTAGARQQAVFGKGGGAAAAQIAKGAGEGVAGAIEALSIPLSEAGRAVFEPIGDTVDDYAAHAELTALQDEMYERLFEYIDELQDRGISFDRAGFWDFLKNTVNSYGYAFNNLGRQRNQNQRSRGRN
jgi:hypothetical protein